jgi:UDP-glucose 4-epimerase
VTSYTGLFDLAKKVAVVTGGAGFLGKHFCRGLAEAGASVVVVDITATEVSAIVATKSTLVRRSVRSLTSLSQLRSKKSLPMPLAISAELTFSSTMLLAKGETSISTLRRSRSTH